MLAIIDGWASHVHRRLHTGQVSVAVASLAYAPRAIVNWSSALIGFSFRMPVEIICLATYTRVKWWYKSFADQLMSVMQNNSILIRYTYLLIN